MTLDINGYNDNFKAFVEFAQQRKNANDANAVIDAHENTLGGRKILAGTQSVTDEVDPQHGRKPRKRQHPRNLPESCHRHVRQREIDSRVRPKGDAFK